MVVLVVVVVWRFEQLSVDTIIDVVVRQSWLELGMLFAIMKGTVKSYCIDCDGQCSYIQLSTMI